MKQKSVDSAGRLVIPKNFRENLKIDESTMLTITVENGAVIIRPKVYYCKLCSTSLINDKEIALCDNCIRKIKSN